MSSQITSEKKAFSPTTIPTLISIVMLFSGIPEFVPYGYYTLLRLVVCGTSIYIVYFSFEKEKKVIGSISILFAFIFNPIIPIHFGKEVWVLIDIIAALFYGVTIFILRFELDKEIELDVLRTKIGETKWKDEGLIEKTKTDENLKVKKEEYDKEIEKMLDESEMLNEN
jgi:hypothetical protein